MPRLSGEPGTGASTPDGIPPVASRSFSVGGGASGPGQISPVSVTSGGTSGFSPFARSTFSLSLTGMFGLLPPENGGFHHVS